MSFFILIVAFFLSAAAAGEEVEVTTSLGTIRGTTLKTRLGADFSAFRGIRYAESPTGSLRFVNPQPVAPWKPTVFDATTDGPMCPQVTANITDISEDCLRLNVYTKDLKALKPVIVYIHPGGFYSVSGQSKNFAGPQYMMDRDVVFVTINYRLGTLGFLATGDANAPGNSALKDQVIALRWIQTHIKDFGGDPGSVTLLGYSAGSLSIGLHMLSPMSKGLFHRGIAMSASPFGQWDYNFEDLRLAKRQAKLLDCTVESAQALVSCLREKSTLDFVNTMEHMFEFNWKPILLWMPVVEKDFGQERFLVEHPYKTVQSGNFHKVPLITGITEYEFISAAYGDLTDETILHMWNDDFDKNAPLAFMYERDTPRTAVVTKAIRERYLNNANLTFPASLEPFGELYSDSVIGFPYYRFLQLMSPHTPVYTYMFTYKGRYSHFKYPENVTYGAVHHDELLYLLYVPVLTPFFTATDPEHMVIERLTRMWSNFAMTGNPNNAQDEYLKDVDWKLYTGSKKEYLQIGDELTLKTGGIYQERYQLWNDLFPISGEASKGSQTKCLLIVFTIYFVYVAYADVKL